VLKVLATRKIIKTRAKLLRQHNRLEVVASVRFYREVVERPVSAWASPAITPILARLWGERAVGSTNQ